MVAVTLAALVGGALSGWYLSDRVGRVEAAGAAGAAAPARVAGLAEPPPEAYIVLPPDALRAIDRPQFVAAGRAKVAPEAPMVLVRGNSEERAYSLRLLNQHEIVNDVLDGVPIAVTW